MEAEEARVLLGFLPNSHPTPSQVKEAYKNKVWDTHPDRFPVHEKYRAECIFKLISEAYTCLQSEKKMYNIPPVAAAETFKVAAQLQIHLLHMDTGGGVEEAGKRPGINGTVGSLAKGSWGDEDEETR